MPLHLQKNDNGEEEINIIILNRCVNAAIYFSVSIPRRFLVLTDVELIFQSADPTSAGSATLQRMKGKKG